MFCRIPLVAVSVLLAARPAIGGELLNEGSRVRVKSSGEVGDDGRVTPSKGDHWIVGTLLTIDPDYLTVAAQGRPAARTRVPRTAVTDLEISRGRSRGKGALIGAGIGAVVGLGWGALVYSGVRSTGRGELGFVAPVMVPVPVGIIVGLAIGKERWAKMSPTTLDLAVMPVGGGIRIAGSVKF